MTRLENFISGVNVLREYVEWEQKVYDLGIDLQETKISILFNELLNQIQEGNNNFGWDKLTERNWIIEWCYNVNKGNIFVWNNQSYEIENAEQLFYFIKEHHMY